MVNKQELTRKLIDQLPGEDRPDFETAYTAWWQDWRHDTGLRLTTEGRDLLDFLEYESHQFEIPNIIAIIPRNLLILDFMLLIRHRVQVTVVQVRYMLQELQVLLQSLTCGVMDKQLHT